MKTVHLLARPDQVYLDVELSFDGDEHPEIDRRLFKFAIVLALKQLFGEVGSVIPIDVLRYDQERMRAYLRTTAKDLVKVWSSLTLFSSYNDATCTFRVYKVSTSLASLSVSSTNYRHVVIDSGGNG